MPRFYAVLISLISAWLVLCAFSLSVGSIDIPLNDVFQNLFGIEPIDTRYALIIEEYRMPKLITASMAGAALAVSGLLMQTLFSNPLAGPYILGISSGASLGVAFLVLGISFFPSLSQTAWLQYSTVFGAWVGATSLMLIVLAVAKRIQSAVTLLITGLMFGYIASSIVSILSYFSTAEQLQTFFIWNMGSFSNVQWSSMPVYIGVISLGLFLSILCSHPLNAMLMGENYASSIGVPIKLMRMIVIVISSLLAGTTTAFCGPISFLGIAVPHIARSLLKSSDHRILMPVCIAAGMFIAVCSDLIAGWPGSQKVLPLNAITSLLGAPFVIYIITRSSKR